MTDAERGHLYIGLTVGFTTGALVIGLLAWVI
jgi:hypothetical protein